MVETQADITLEEIASRIAQRHGHRFAPNVIWRLFERHELTLKKPHTPLSRHARTLPRIASRVPKGGIHER